jgi:hypothetical protein
MGTGTSGFGLTQPATGNQGYGQATTSGATATGKNCTVQGQQSLQREHLFKVEDGGTPGADQYTLSRNGWSAPGDRPCGEFVVVPRTPRPSPPPPPGLVMVYSRVNSLQYSFSQLERFTGFGIPVHGNGDITSGHPGEQRLLSNLLCMQFQEKSFQ